MGVLAFVVPVYNGETTISRTIESIISQTDDNWKLVIVDDGSTDNSLQICCGYSDNYPDKITYISQPNRGLGGARNTGIEHFLKDNNVSYISFLDADDWLMEDYCERIYTSLDRCADKPDIVMTLPVVWNENTRDYSEWKDKDDFEEIFKYDGDLKFPSNCLDIYDLEVSACRKVLAIDFIRKTGFRFREHIKYEDVVPHYQLLHKCNACMGISSVGFYYRKGNSNQITNSRGIDRLDIIPILDELLNYSLSIGDSDIYFSVMRTIIRFSIWCIRMADSPFRRQLVVELHDLYKKIPIDYKVALKKGVRGKYSRKDALQYELVLIGISYKCFNPIFYWEWVQKIGEVLVRTLLHANKKVK